jgi:hypothetical protein
MKRHILLLPICSLLLMNCGGGSHRTQTGDAGRDATGDTGTQPDVRADVADTKPATDTHDGGTDAHDGSTVTDTASEQPGDTTAATYTVGGTVTGLSGSGLVLQNNLGSNLTVTAGQTTFTFAGGLTTGTAYAVTVATQPGTPAQTCTVAQGTGTIGTVDVSDVAVTCVTNTFTIGGTISGLLGTGLVLRNNGGDDLTVAANATNFTFATSVASGATFAVTIQTQPSAPIQTCTLMGNTGTVGSAAVTGVAINCATDAALVGGTVIGLAGTLVLRNNGADTQTVTSNGSFSFPTPVASGGAYAVTVLTQPTNPSQTCAVSNDTGTVSSTNVTSVMVTCTTNAYTVGGSVSGLNGTGLVLRDNGGDDITIPSGATGFTFPTSVTSGAPFAVTIHTQPTSPSQTCTLVGGTGTVGSSNVNSVALDCTTSTFLVGGTIGGLAGTVVLQNNGGDTQSISANGSFAFPTSIVSGGTFAVTVQSQPGTPSQTCTVTHGSGSIANTDISDVAINCVTNSYTIGGSMAAVMGGGMIIRNNGGDDFHVAAGATSFTFATPILSGNTFSVTIVAEPTTPSQTCTVAGGSGTVGGANVTSISINCASNAMIVGGHMNSLVNSVVLRNNGGDDLTVTSNGTFAFATPVISGQTYSITVGIQPTNPTQVCTVTQGTGTVFNTPVLTAQVNCTTTKFPVRVSVSGLTGSGLTVQNGSDVVSIPSNGTYLVTAAVPSGSSYSVGVISLPANQLCAAISANGGVMGGSAVTVSLVCVSAYTVKGTVTGATGTVTLDNGGDEISVGNGAFSFPTKVPAGNPYAVTVTPPAGQDCFVYNGSGTIGNADAVVTVSCAYGPLVYHFPFDGDASDTSGNGNHGTVNGATLVPDRHGTANSAYAFDGSSSWIGAPGTALPIGNNARTLSAWVRPYDTRGIWGIVHWGNGDCSGLMFGIANQGAAGFWGGCNDFITDMALNPNDWAFVAVRFTPPDMYSVRVNSEVETMQLGAADTRPSSLYIGAETTDDGDFRNYFYGELDDIRIYDRDLSDAELDSVYALP